MTLDFVDQAGNTRLRGQLKPAPSSRLVVVTVPIAFNTPSLVLAGITLVTLEPGDTLIGSSHFAPYTSWISKSVVWDGNQPTIWLTTPLQQNTTYMGTSQLNFSGNSDYFGDGTLFTIDPGPQDMFSAGPLVAAVQTPIIAFVDDGAGPGGGGADPGSTMGAGSITLQILRA